MAHGEKRGKKRRRAGDAASGPPPATAVPPQPGIPVVTAAAPPEAAHGAGGDAPGGDRTCLRSAVDPGPAATVAGADALGRYHAKLVEVVAETAAAGPALFAALAGAGSLEDAAAINADHLRARLDAMAGQGRDLAALALDALRSVLGDPPTGVRRL